MSNVQFYMETIDVNDVDGIEARFKRLVESPIHSAADLEKWLADEKNLHGELDEVTYGHQVDFFRDTRNKEKRDAYMHDETVVIPLRMKYQAQLDKKFCDSPFADKLDEQRYGLMRRLRRTRAYLLREENTLLTIRENELKTKYNEVMGGLVVEWEGERNPIHT